MMLKRIIPMALLAASLVVIAGVALASVAPDDDVASSEIAATTTMVGDDHGSDDEYDEVTTTTMAEDPDDDDDEYDEVTTTTMADDPDDDDEYGDDESSETFTKFESGDDYDEYGYMIEDGVHVIDASPLGSITVEVKDGMLYLTSVDIDSMWMLDKEELKSDEIELGFYKGDSELKIKVEIDEGQLKKMVEIDMDDDYDEYGYMIEDGVHVIDASPLGSITVEVKDGMLYLTSVDIDSMWMLDKEELKSDEIELGFYKGDSELKIKVEIDNGDLKKSVDIDIKG